MFYQGYREHVPEVFRKNVSDQEVNLVGGVGVRVVPIPRGSQAIMRTCGRDAPDGLDLDAPKDLAGADNNVVTVAVPLRLGDGESESCGFAHEGEFGNVAAMLAIEFSGKQEFIL